MHDSPIQILLVEDNAGDARLVETYLRRAEDPQFSVQRVDRLGKGLERLREGGIDVVLLDLTLPDSQGIDTFETAVAEAPDVPIIVMTGIDDSAVALKAVRDGAQDYLVKRQVDTHLLVRSIRYAIQRKHFEEQIRISEERYALAVDGANDGVWDWDLGREEIYFSTRWKSLLGYQGNELMGGAEEWFDRVHPDDIERLRNEIKVHLEGRTQHFESEHRLQHRDGAYRWVLSRGVAVQERSGPPHRRWRIRVGAEDGADLASRQRSRIPTFAW